MRINNPIPGYNMPGRQGSRDITKTNNEKANTGKQNLPAGIDTQDSYIPSQQKTEEAGNGFGYGKPGLPGKDVGSRTVKPDTATIQQLKDQSEQTYSQLREMVRQMLERQGLTFQDLKGFDGEIVVDEQARTEAAAAIAEGGPLSAEAVSDRIVEFAKAISGGDKTKLDTLRSAIDKGFSEAERILGGNLPEISHKTRELINEKLADWENEE
jgi:hypothetical protein